MTEKKQVSLIMDMYHKSKEERNAMYNSGIFNEITIAYAEEAMKIYQLDDIIIQGICCEIQRLHEEKTSSEILAKK